MKPIWFALTFSIVFLGWSVAFAQDDDFKDHLTIASRLEEKAKAQDELIAWHRKMRGSAAGRSLGQENVPSGTGMDILAGEMQRHCEEIIQTSIKLKEELLEFAEWHRERVMIKTDTPQEVDKH